MAGNSADERKAEEIDQGDDSTGGEVASRALSDQSEHPKEPAQNNGKTWSEWAADNAFRVKDSALSTVKYVSDTATSLAGVAQPTTDVNSKKGDVGKGDEKSATQTWVESGIGLKNTITTKLGYPGDNQSSDNSAKNAPMSVQDVIDRYSTTTRTPEAGQISVTKAVIDIGLGLKDGIATQFGCGPQPDTPAATRAAGMQERTRNIAESWRGSAVSAFTPGDGDRDLASTISNKLSIGGR